MVYTGVSEERRVAAKSSMAMNSERTAKSLHNFNLPWDLKWGNQRHLRCMKMDSDAEGEAPPAAFDRRSRLESVAVGMTRRRGESDNFDRRSRLRRPRIENDDGEEGIDAVREKLMFEFKTAADKMKDAILRVEEEDEEPAAATTDVAAAAEEDAEVAEEGGSSPAAAAAAVRPWNLRTRRAACKAPIGGSAKGLRIEDRKANYSPLRSEGNNGVKSPRLVRGASGSGLEKKDKEKERPKFSLTLTKKEIEEDFMEMLGHRPPRRPKKRPRAVQKQLDALFPGMWLTEVSADSYKVPEFPENVKVATKYPANALVHRPALAQFIVSLKIKTPAQLEAAMSFFANTGPEDFKISEFEEACGVGVEVSEEEIKQSVNEVFEENKSAILEQRYKTNVGDLFGHVRKKHPWADPKIVKASIDTKLLELLGERTAADDEKVPKKKKEKPAKVEAKAIAVSTPEQPSEEILNPYSIFPQPEENFKVHTSIFFSDGSILRCCNTKELLEKHLNVTGGRVLTRFPPEPNGYLHIGHAKAMFIDFGLANERGGGCYLRFDDTNPEAEKKEYIDHIQEIVSWMGWEPYKITYTSDYFQDLYDLAVELIRRGHAYIDHQTGDEIKEYREKKMNSPWRDRPIDESLKLFEDMRRGLIGEGKATLRMKQDMQSDNFNMYDLIAYRIKFTPHPHAGDKWCIYPSYDYAHCIVDSLENITHSLCTLEFETRRASYYWLLHALGLYQPHVWEYSRLNVSNTVMSKRKLNRLVTENWVDGWDDPRLMTLAGLRRRGVTSSAINAFVRGIGITRSDCSMIHLSRLEYHIREELNKTAPRMMVVLDPVKVVITNWKDDLIRECDARKWPDSEAESYKVPFSNVIYIERSDFRLKDSKDYFGLAPGKSALLRYACPIKCVDAKDVILAEDEETVLEIRVEYDPEKKTKPKGVLHWVAQPSPGVDPLKVEVRLFDRLFNSENPSELDDWLSDLSEKSKVVIPNAITVPSLGKDVGVGDKFQFERLGYFVVDKDSTPDKLVFNRTVTLRDSYKSGK